jgi:hypothetical protein
MFPVDFGFGVNRLFSEQTGRIQENAGNLSGWAFV